MKYRTTRGGKRIRTTRRGDFMKLHAVKCDLDSSYVRFPFPLVVFQHHKVSLRVNRSSQSTKVFAKHKGITYISSCLPLHLSRLRIASQSYNK